ncbi:sugar ABC transporter permease [Streptomyces sp. SL13]|uniref:Sugar ABC transporter permease n=1 Tax=Streptantibioticus silvisoli TaxID=2705255 RepID=A0AA90KIA7_9ACTN|nr:sugar ABC transporter permease [Streptantibioticus silvisoli]MDI5963792.1 sugar ABC transporter permease [Streptantibioticus silvisoli]MDI5972825.1 sugar ABC transporter permease [Streptantibioticus silvisoli]
MTTETRAPAPTRTVAAPRRGRGRRALVPWLYLAPALLFFAVFRFWPTAWGIYLSLYKVRPYLGNQWVGADNFVRALHDPALRSAVWHTVVDALATVVGSAVAGFALALLLEGPARLLKLFRTAVFLPVVVSMVAIAELWSSLLFPGRYGAANSVLHLAGVGPLPFLSSPHSALVSVILVQVWKSAPYDMIIFVAGLAGIDRELYEAASLDGAGLLQRLRYVTLPALRPTTTVVLTLGVIRGMRVFTEIYVLTNGGPNGASQTVVPYDYLQATTNNDIGYAAAISTLFLLITVALTLLVQRWRGRRES